MSEQSDLELVLLSQQGNKAAFGQLVLRYQPMAQRLATQIIGDRDLAQELVQDAMLQAYLSLQKLNDPTRFKSWLYGIVLNICRNDLRRRKVICFSLEVTVGNLVDELPVTEGSSSDPQLVVEREELQTALLEAVDTLSPKNRSAILLFYHEQFSLQEVANRLKISISAVKGRLHKSRHQLREQLSLLQDQSQPNSFQEIQTMTTNTSSQPKLEPCCSFCRKNSEQVDTLIAGPGVFICNACVDICNQILSGKIPPSPLTQEEVAKLMDSGKLSD
ncbi:sigma-70 family RNA polymerase sigma factor [Leptolyngbya sp. FACHB-671]|uniref:sigma-70 family RNA polymerase sigma factor n=1 Tax=unclassified Leptolyngbya TaxID=2650499 RepID=UPI0016822C84|nr:sigma-70 family RNA polymerase sigma factor [Leptolyngbya sp. FACHB-541]MBD2067881.1 sigma-70 family RNA polymerase sigma factor [Leptolyngbya sp. FACHB-671]